jgi:hypothetical protein
MSAAPTPNTARGPRRTTTDRYLTPKPLFIETKSASRCALPCSCSVRVIGAVTFGCPPRRLGCLRAERLLHKTAHTTFWVLAEHH